MTRRLTLVLAALEALVTVAIGIAIPLALLTLTWAVQLGFAPDWLIFWRAAVDIWLMGHGVDLTITLDPTLAGGLGVIGAEAPVPLTITLLGFALLTVALGMRAGRRLVESEHPVLGGAAATLIAAVLSGLLTWSAQHPVAMPSLAAGTALPALVFGGAILVGALRERARQQEGDVRPAGAVGPVSRFWRDLPRELRVGLLSAGRIGASAVALTSAVSALLVLVLLVTSYAQVLRLYEAAHTGVVGGIVLTGLQLTLMPDLVIWAASWLIGPGFAIGTGSHVSPIGTALGPLPPLPVLGAIPTVDLALGFAGLLVPVVAGFLSGAASRALAVRGLGEAPGRLWAAATGLGGGVVGGLLFGLLAAAASGSAGPGRLGTVGPDPVAVGLAAAAEFGVAAAIGMLSAGVLPRLGARVGSRLGR